MARRYTAADVAALLAAAKSRGAVKALGERLDADEALRDAVVARIGDSTDVDLRQHRGKKIVRLALSRSTRAQRRKNPIARDEEFTCCECARHVPMHGRTARDHCPYCLTSRHVDDVPGDRANLCGATMDPIGVEGRAGDTVILYRCRGCGVHKRNRALLDGDPCDDWQQIVSLAANSQS